MKEEIEILEPMEAKGSLLVQCLIPYGACTYTASTTRGRGKNMATIFVRVK